MRLTIHVSTYRKKFYVLRYKLISYEYFVLRIGQLDLLYCFTVIKMKIFFQKNFVNELKKQLQKTTAFKIIFVEVQ